MQIDLGICPNLSKTLTVGEWRKIANKLVRDPDHETRDLGGFLLEQTDRMPLDEAVKIRVDDRHAALIKKGR